MDNLSKSGYCHLYWLQRTCFSWGWTRWSPEIPLSPYDSIISWFCGSVTSHRTLMSTEFGCQHPKALPIWGIQLAAGIAQTDSRRHTEQPVFEAGTAAELDQSSLPSLCSRSLLAPLCSHSSWPTGKVVPYTQIGKKSRGKSWITESQTHRIMQWIPIPLLCYLWRTNQRKFHLWSINFKLWQGSPFSLCTLIWCDGVHPI